MQGLNLTRRAGPTTTAKVRLQRYENRFLGRRRRYSLDRGMSSRKLITVTLCAKKLRLFHSNYINYVRRASETLMKLIAFVKFALLRNMKTAMQTNVLRLRTMTYLGCRRRRKN